MTRPHRYDHVSTEEKEGKREALLGGVLVMALTFLCIAAGVAPTSWARLLCSGLASTVLAAFIAHAWPSK